MPWRKVSQHECCKRRKWCRETFAYLLGEESSEGHLEFLKLWKLKSYRGQRVVVDKQREEKRVVEIFKAWWDNLLAPHAAGATFSKAAQATKKKEEKMWLVMWLMGRLMVPCG